MEDHDNKYHIGDSVYSKSAPNVELIVRRYIKRIYYCTDTTNPKAKDQVLFEREILDKQTE